MGVIVEGCVTTVEEAVRCAEAGADRLELCESLDTGGLTPSVELVTTVVAAVDIPVFAMVRPRPGDFVHGSAEVARMLADIAALLSAGVSGIVAGVLGADRRVDQEAMRGMVEAVRPLPMTFHRAFDQVPNMDEALETLVSLGVARVLTSGGADTAIRGMDVLAGLVKRSAGRLVVMPGGRVRASNVAELVRRTAAVEVHARAIAVPDIVRALPRY